MTAIQAKQAALATQYATVSDADQVLLEALVSAHAATVEGVARLDAGRGGRRRVNQHG